MDDRSAYEAFEAAFAELQARALLTVYPCGTCRRSGQLPDDAPLLLRALHRDYSPPPGLRNPTSAKHLLFLETLALQALDRTSAAQVRSSCSSA